MKDFYTEKSINKIKMKIQEAEEMRETIKDMKDLIARTDKYKT